MLLEIVILNYYVKTKKVVEHYIILLLETRIQVHHLKSGLIY